MIAEMQPFNRLRRVRLLITGGTGSFGKAFVKAIYACLPEVERVVIFSRDELKQFEMSQLYPPDRYPSIRFFLGDVRDVDRLRRAMHNIDIVVHAAALKQVPACEYNPIEAVMTNVIGAKNIIDAAIDVGVRKVVALSSDKAVNPVNLYGATKLVAEKLFIQANAYSGTGPTRFSCIRYGNVVGSRGSVIPLFQKQRDNGRLTVTDPRMTRFWITLDQGVKFVINCIERMHGGEVFVPKIPSMNIMDLVKAVAPDCEVEKVGIRPGEKLHEALISEDEARNTLEFEDMFIIQPTHQWWQRENCTDGRSLTEGFRYTSDSNEKWLTVKELQALVQELS